MAQFAPNNTGRVFVDYVTGNQAYSKEHTLTLRPGPSAASASDIAFQFLSLIGVSNFLTGWRPIRLRVQGAGEDFSFPVEMESNLAAFVGTGSVSGFTEAFEAVQHTLQGRTASSGTRASIQLYGIRSQIPTKFRFLPSEAPFNGWLPAMLTALNASEAGLPLVAVDNVRPIWYPYINVNYNSYWEGAIRRG